MVTLVDDRDTASLPTVSWTAAFDVAELDDGAAYATVTVFPEPTGEPRASCTVEPLTETELTVTGEPSAVTVNADAAAVVLPSDSLYVSVRVVPAAFTAADWNTGGTPIGVTAEEAGDAPDVASMFVAVVWNV